MERRTVPGVLGRRRGWIVPVLLLALVPALPACAPRRVATAPVAASGAQARLALFPPENLTGTGAPLRGLLISLETALAASGLDVVSGDIVDQFLARHRIRFTGGLDRASARAAREELGVDGVLIASLELYATQGTPKFAMTMRLVSTREDPAILWIDGTSRSGNDSPGLLNLGLVASMKKLETLALADLAGSLQSFLRGEGAGPRPCPAESRFGAQVFHGSPRLGDVERPTVVVLPFVNETERRRAGEAVALEFARQLSAAGFRVVEPGVVRDSLLKYRIIMEDGASLDTASLTLELLKADLALTGYVRDYGDYDPPVVEFSTYLLDKGKSVWSSSSRHQGNDGVFFFDLGRVSTAPGLACRMARSVAVEMAKKAILAPGP